MRITRRKPAPPREPTDADVALGTSGVAPFVVREQATGGGQWAWPVGRFLYTARGLWSAGRQGGVGEQLSESFQGSLECAPSGVCITGRREGADFVFSYVDPATGEVQDASRIDFREPFTNFALSPDGKTAAVVHLNDNVIRLIDVASGDESTISVAGRSLFEFVAWSADGSKLFVNAGFATSGSYPVLLSVEMDGTAHVLRERANVWHVSPTPSPDGRYLAFGAMPFQGNAYLLTGF